MVTTHIAANQVTHPPTHPPTHPRCTCHSSSFEPHASPRSTHLPIESSTTTHPNHPSSSQKNSSSAPIWWAASLSMGVESSSPLRSSTNPPTHPPTSTHKQFLGIVYSGLVGGFTFNGGGVYIGHFSPFVSFVATGAEGGGVSKPTHSLTYPPNPPTYPSTPPNPASSSFKPSLLPLPNSPTHPPPQRTIYRVGMPTTRASPPSTSPLAASSPASGRPSCLVPTSPSQVGEPHPPPLLSSSLLLLLLLPPTYPPFNQQPTHRQWRIQPPSFLLSIQPTHPPTHSKTAGFLVWIFCPIIGFSGVESSTASVALWYVPPTHPPIYPSHPPTSPTYPPTHLPHPPSHPPSQPTHYYTVCGCGCCGDGSIASPGDDRDRERTLGLLHYGRWVGGWVGGGV